MAATGSRTLRPAACAVWNAGPKNSSKGESRNRQRRMPPKLQNTGILAQRPSFVPRKPSLSETQNFRLNPGSIDRHPGIPSKQRTPMCRGRRRRRSQSFPRNTPRANRHSSGNVGGCLRKGQRSAVEWSGTNGGRCKRRSGRSYKMLRRRIDWEEHASRSLLLLLRINRLKVLWR